MSERSKQLKQLKKALSDVLHTHSRMLHQITEEHGGNFKTDFEAYMLIRTLEQAIATADGLVEAFEPYSDDIVPFRIDRDDEGDCDRKEALELALVSGDE